MNKNFISKIRSFGLSSESLANKSGILVERVISILQGDTEPTISEVRKLAKALRISPDFLINEDAEVPSLNVLFRKAFNQNDSKVERLSYIVNNCLSLLDNYHLNKDIFAKFPKVENTFEGARILAKGFRELFYGGDFINPIYDLPQKIANELNCIVLIYELGNYTDGASLIIDNIPFIIVCPRFEPRMFFTLAHELGHILAHHRESAFVVIDNNTITTRNLRKREEAFAHAFASELLMPSEGVGATLRTIRRVLGIKGDVVGDVEILYLSRVYGVSFEVAALRCENLGLIPEGAGISLLESIAKESKNPENRARELGLPERNKILFSKVSSNVLNPAIEKIKLGELSLEKASELLAMSVVDIIKHNSNY